LAQNETICKRADIKIKIHQARFVMGLAAKNLEICCAARLLPLSCACHGLVMMAVGASTRLRNFWRVAFLVIHRKNSFSGLPCQ
jgi:hypothetical protein